MRVGGRTVAPRPNRMETLEKLRIARPLDARRAGLWAARAAVAAAFLVAMILDVRGERPPPRDRQPLPTFAGRSGRSHVDPRLSGVARTDGSQRRGPVLVCPGLAAAKRRGPCEPPPG